MTKSENFSLKEQAFTMSLFRLTFLKAHWLAIMLAVVAADDAYVQETIGKEERLHFKNATLQRHYGRTAGHSMAKLQQHCAGILRGRSIPVEGLRKRELTNIERAKLEAKKVSCKPRVVNLELPPAPLGTSYYPQCVTAKRCGGCCHSALLECRPTKTTTVKKWVMKFQVEPKNKYDKNHFFRIEQHKSCECGCKTLPSHCRGKQVYDEESCVCKCENESEIKACGHPKEWDPDLCSCVCPQSLFCSTGAHIHPDSCKCVSGNNSK